MRFAITHIVEFPEGFNTFDAPCHGFGLPPCTTHRQQEMRSASERYEELVAFAAATGATITQVP